MFCTLFYCLVDIKEKKIFYTSAGHDEQVIYNPGNGMVTFLKTKGIPIGVKENADYEVKSYDYNPGDILLLFTDGLIEQNQSKTLDLQDILQIFNNNQNTDVKVIIDKIKLMHNNILEGQNADDDTTCLIAEL